MVDGEVGGYLVEPGPQRAVRIGAADAPQQAQEGFLGDVLGQRAIGGEPPGEPVHRCRVAAVDAFEGGLVAALIARAQRPTLAALVPAVLVVAGVVGMIVQMPGHPMWMAVAGLLLPIPAALAGAKLAAHLRRKG